MMILKIQIRVCLFARAASVSERHDRLTNPTSSDVSQNSLMSSSIRT